MSPGKPNKCYQILLHNLENSLRFTLYFNCNKMARSHKIQHGKTFILADQKNPVNLVLYK